VASSSSGIAFNNTVDENYQKNYFDSFAYVYNGAGVATGDFNNDGLMDIYFTGNEVSNKLYINQGGLKFKDITEFAGVAGCKGWKNGVTLVDINNDGFLISTFAEVATGTWMRTEKIYYTLTRAT
jgi:hypothetical protein